MYAMSNCITTDIIVHFAPISARITLIVAMQGVYKRQNVKNESALAGEKLITLVESPKLVPTRSIDEILLIIPILLTISSFATIPAKSALTAPHSPKPRGAKIGAMICATLCKMLVLALLGVFISINSKLSVKLCKSQMMIEKKNI